MKSHLLLLCGVAGVTLLFLASGARLAVGLVIVGGLFSWALAASLGSDEQATGRQPKGAGDPLRTSTGPAASTVLVPLFTGQEQLEVLVPLARLLPGDASRVTVVHIEEVPRQSPFWAFHEHDAQVTSGFASACAGLPDSSFEGVLTHRREELLGERASLAEISWVVMSWPPRPPWWRVFDPLTRFINDPPCNLVVYRPANDTTLFRTPRILVLASRGPLDAVLTQFSARVAAWSDAANITLAHLAPLEATSEDLHEIHAYHERLVPAGVAARAHIVRSTDRLQALLQLSQGFDLLLLGRARHRDPACRSRRALEDQLALSASCAVIQLRLGRDVAHYELSPADVAKEGWPSQ